MGPRYDTWSGSIWYMYEMQVMISAHVITDWIGEVINTLPQWISCTYVIMLLVWRDWSIFSIFINPLLVYRSDSFKRECPWFKCKQWLICMNHHIRHLKRVDYVNNNAQISNVKIKKNSLLNTEVLQLVSPRIVYMGQIRFLKPRFLKNFPEAPEFLHFPRNSTKASNSQNLFTDSDLRQWRADSMKACLYSQNNFHGFFATKKGWTSEVCRWFGPYTREETDGYFARCWQITSWIMMMRFRSVLCPHSNR